MFETPGPCLLIEPLCISPHTFLERRVDEDLKERGGSGQFPHHPTFGAKRRDERANHDEPGFGHQFRDFTDAPDVFDPVGISPEAAAERVLDELRDRKIIAL